MRFLLFLPLLSLLAGCSAPTVAPDLLPLEVPAGERPEAWAADIEQLIAGRPAVDEPVVFLGSSSIRLWRSLEADMAPIPVINCGFGGSRIFDSVYWLEDLLHGLEPRALVVFAGTNDITGDRPRDADYMVTMFDALVARLRALGHDVPLLYIAISPTPSRERHLDLVLEVNRRIAARCAEDQQLHFVDTATALLKADGRPDPKWFVADQLHLNADGYASWTATIRPALEDLHEPSMLSSSHETRSFHSHVKSATK